MRDRITASLKDAMRSRDDVRLSTLRLMLAALKDREVAKRGADGADALTPEEVVALFTKMVRQREESVASYEEAGRMDFAERERAEIKVIREFMPRPLSAQEVEDAVAEAVSETGAASIRDMGKVMAALKAKYAGRMDFGAAGAKVKAALG